MLLKLSPQSRPSDALAPVLLKRSKAVVKFRPLRGSQPVDPVKHVFMLYKLAPVGLLNASVHSRDETGVIFEHPRNGFLHQLLGILAVGNGQLLEPRFNVG
jgi:hypothetical protein